MTVIAPKLREIYFHELGFQSAAVYEFCQQVFRVALPPPNVRTFEVVPSQLQIPIGAALAAAANVKKLLDKDRPRGQNESMRAFELRTDRAQMLLEALVGVEISELLKVQARNTLEHFDEYLDKENIRLANDAKPCVAIYNVGVSHSDNFIFEQGPLIVFRKYVTTTKIFENLGRAVDLGKLHAEADCILARLVERGDIPAGGPTGTVSFVNIPPGSTYKGEERDQQVILSLVKPS